MTVQLFTRENGSVVAVHGNYKAVKCSPEVADVVHPYTPFWDIMIEDIEAKS